MDTRIEEALCDLQAQACMQRVALRALARTHPDPQALLAAWRDALAEVSTCDPVAPPHARGSQYLAERFQAFAEDWTAELVDLLVSPRPGG